MRSLALTVTLAVAAGSSGVEAQTMMGTPIRWDLAAANGEGVTSLSLGALHTHDVFPGKRIRLGLGLRTTFVSGEQRLTPAGARDVPAGVIDTLTVSAAALMLNIAGHASVVLSSRLEVGLNIDLAGLGAGTSRPAIYRASPTTATIRIDAAPASTNLFLYGSKDRGSLNSEFFAAWKHGDRLTLRGGLSHQLTEYRARRVLTSNTDRFRHYADLLFIGARITR